MPFEQKSEKSKKSDDENPSSTEELVKTQERLRDPSLNRTTLNALYFLIVAMSLFGNIDHGTLPAGSVVIKQDLDMNNA